MKKQKFTVTDVAVLALLIALNVVLSRWLSIATPAVKIGFTFVTVALGAVLYGPIGGAVVGGCGDLIGALLFPIGAYFPGYTFTAVVQGLLFAVCWRKSHSFWRIVLAVVLTQGLCTLLLNTLWTSILYDKAFFVYLATRLVQSAVMLVVQTATLQLLFNGVRLPERLQQIRRSKE